MATFFTHQHGLRAFLTGLPNDVDGRARATALTKLDELVQWARLAIDK